MAKCASCLGSTPDTRIFLRSHRLMIYGSVCSGIEAATVAWHPIGWRPAFFSEIEAFPCALLNHYYSDVPNLGDMNRFKEWPDATLNILVGGTPCQAFSVAGLRQGLDDPRGNLTLVYLAVIAKYRPAWVVWENVPGVLSDGTGAFGAFLGGLAELGYGFAYRILDAQYFGVPQRRRRVFVVGCLGDWRRAAAVLFERESLCGDSPPSREAWQRTASTLRSGAAGGRSHGKLNGSDRMELIETVGAICADSHPGAYSSQGAYTGRLISHALRADGFDASEDGTGRGTPLVTCFDDPRRFDARGVHGGGIHGDLHPPLNTVNSQHLIAFSSKDHGADAGDTAPTLRAMGHAGSHPNAGGQVAVAFDWQSGGDSRGLDPKDTAQLQRCQVPAMLSAMQVRRLTPRECERLQGFPDDYTLIPYRGKPAADGPRYKALGNSMAVPVMRWIGDRIQLAESVR